MLKKAVKVCCVILEVLLLIANLGVLLVGAFMVDPLVARKLETNYAEYYAKAKNNMQLEKSQKKAECTRAVKSVDTDSLRVTSESYSFTVNDCINIKEYYYDCNVKYIEDNTYDCTCYEYSCLVTPQQISTYTVIVVGDGDMSISNSGQVLDLEKISSKQLERFAKEILENEIDSSYESISCVIGLFDIVAISMVVAIILFKVIKPNEEGTENE